MKAFRKKSASLLLAWVLLGICTSVSAMASPQCTSLLDKILTENGHGTFYTPLYSKDKAGGGDFYFSAHGLHTVSTAFRQSFFDVIHTGEAFEYVEVDYTPACLISKFQCFYNKAPSKNDDFVSVTAEACSAFFGGADLKTSQSATAVDATVQAACLSELKTDCTTYKNFLNASKSVLPLQDATSPHDTSSQSKCLPPFSPKTPAWVGDSIAPLKK